LNVIPSSARIEKTGTFGYAPDGQAIDIWELDNGRGVSMRLLSFGGVVLDLICPDQTGRRGNILLTPGRVEDVTSPNGPYLNALIGRVCNRIRGGQFSLDGREYQLSLNDNGRYSLHGGRVGYDKRIWAVRPLQVTDGVALELTLTDDGASEGYPGTVCVRVVYTLTTAGAWRIDYEATTDAPTPINLTQHAYFNLKDAGRTSALDHILKLHATHYTPADATLMPTGEVVPVAGTPLDYTTAKPLGADFNRLTCDPVGVDYNFVINAPAGVMRVCAEVYEPVSGRTLTVRTTEPGVQVYTGNFLNGTMHAPEGFVYGQYHGFCLETQHYPNSVNVPTFPSTILRPGGRYASSTEYVLGVR
jgi:aldose 1-epimerase